MATSTPDPPEFETYRPSSSSIKILGRHFIDTHGRILDLRGVNVGASSKSYACSFDRLRLRV